jgi:hypothetical protein
VWLPNWGLSGFFDFKLIADSFDPFDPTKRFLDHLLLVEGIDLAAQDDSSWDAFQEDFAAGSVGVGLNHAIDAV